MVDYLCYWDHYLFGGTFQFASFGMGGRKFFISTCVFGGIVEVAVLISCGFMCCGCHYAGKSIALFV